MAYSSCNFKNQLKLKHITCTSLYAKNNHNLSPVSFYRLQTKLRKGNVFTSVCQELCPRGVYTSPWQADNPPCPLGRQTPPWQADPPSGRQTPWKADNLPSWQANPPPPQADSRPSSRWLLQRKVRILLECILVTLFFVWLSYQLINFTIGAKSDF